MQPTSSDRASSAVPQPARLRRGRGRRGPAGLFAIALAGTGSGVLYSLAVVESWAAGFAPAALLVAGLLVLVSTACLLEGVTLFPEAPGASALVRRAFGGIAAAAVAWSATIALISAAAIAALAAGAYLGGVWNPLGRTPGDLFGALAILSLAAVATARGHSESPGLRAFAGLAGVATELVLAIAGGALLLRPDVLVDGLRPGALPPVTALAVGVAAAVVAYTDPEALAGVSRHLRDPDRELPRAALPALAVSVSVAVGLSLVSPMAMSGGGRAGTATGAAADPPAAPLLRIAAGLPLRVVATGARDILGLVAAGVLAVFVHQALRGGACMATGLVGELRRPTAAAVRLPDRPPAAAVAAAASAAAALLLVPAAAGARLPQLLAGLVAFGALPVMAAAQAAVVAIRLRDPHRLRPFAVPGSVRVRSRLIPVPAVAGAACAAGLWVVLIAAGGPAGPVGLALAAAAGLVGAVLARAPASGHGLRRRPAEEVAFRSILIPVATVSPEPPAHLFEVAAELASEQRGLIVVLALTEIPLGEEMDVELPHLEQTLERLRRQARLVAETFAIRVQVTHLRTRDPAAAILSEADHRDAQVIVLVASRPGAPGRTPVELARRITAEARRRVMFVQAGPEGA
ncbi:MAG TPA: amino acid permease [Gaiellales bacterium]|nr:amino acid permease [Gaiellales bacterium]